MLQINQLKLPVEEASTKENEYSALLYRIAGSLHLNSDMIDEIQIQKKSLDARKKPQLFYVYCIS